MLEDANPIGTPQEYGFPINPNPAQLRCWTRQEAFLAEFAHCGAVNVSASVAGHSVASYEFWVSQDTYGFQKRYDLAQACYLENCVIEIDRRAFEGINKPIYYKGKLIDTIKDYSDNLAMFRVKKLDPSYRDSHDIVLVDIPDEVMAALRSAKQRDVLAPVDESKIIEHKSDVPPPWSE